MYHMNPVYKLIAPIAILFIDYRILGKYWGYFCMDSIGGYFSSGKRRKWILAACGPLIFSESKAGQGQTHYLGKTE